MIVEPCPEKLAHLDFPVYGGHLFFNEDLLAGCINCGWSGVPTVHQGFASTRCPVCEHEPDSAPQRSNVVRLDQHRAKRKSAKQARKRNRRK